MTPSPSAQYRALLQRLMGLQSFLDGSLPLDGVWFGDKHPAKAGRYWWRKHMHEVFAEIAATLPQDAMQESGWRCFHCNQLFTDENLAREHFGKGNGMPRCAEDWAKGAGGGPHDPRSKWLEELQADRDAFMASNASLTTEVLELRAKLDESEAALVTASKDVVRLITSQDAPQVTPQAVQVTDALRLIGNIAEDAMEGAGMPEFTIYDEIACIARKALVMPAAQPQAQPPQDYFVDIDDLRGILKDDPQPPAQSHACEPVAWCIRSELGIYHGAHCSKERVERNASALAQTVVSLYPPAPSPASAQRALVEKWKPIKSAPKDGTRIIIYPAWPYHTSEKPAGYRAGEAYWDDKSGDWRIANTLIPCTPKVWKPMPTAALDAAGRGEG